MHELFFKDFVFACRTPQTTNEEARNLRQLLHFFLSCKGRMDAVIKVAVRRACSKFCLVCLERGESLTRTEMLLKRSYAASFYIRGRQMKATKGKTILKHVVFLPGS